MIKKNIIALAAINASIGEHKANTQRILDAIEQARQKGAKLLVLPELATACPNAGDLFFRNDFILENQQILSSVVAHSDGIIVIFGTVLRHKGLLYNVAAIAFDGELIAYVPKRYPDAHCTEERYFTRWDAWNTDSANGVPIGDYTGPLGEISWLEVCVGSLGLHPEARPGALLVEIRNRAYETGNYRESIARRMAFAEEFGLRIASTNCLGSDDGCHIYDGGAYIIDQGKLEALGQRFVFDSDLVMCFSDDNTSNAYDPSLSHLQKTGSCPTNDKDYPFVELEIALSLGLRDYLRRAHAKTLALALSGGRDAAMCAILAWRMCTLDSGKNPDPSDIQKRMAQFLITAYLPNGSSSSNETKEAAAALAKELGAFHTVIDISKMVEATQKIAEITIKRPLTWEKDDLTLQNIQARTRSSIIWTLANAHQALLLVTSNQSEAAVGYTTMDGDSSGCLAPIANLPKTLVSRWLEWAKDFYQLKSLDLVLKKAPTAELRPLNSEQNDESDLMPYPVLDTYIEHFIFKRQSPKEVFEHAKEQLGKYYDNDEDIKKDIQKFIRMTSQAQWKRNRFANSFKVLTNDLDPKSDLRWPSLQTWEYEF